MMLTKVSYEACKNCLTNHIGSVLGHIMALVINSLVTALGTDTHAHIHTQHKHT